MFVNKLKSFLTLVIIMITSITLVFGDTADELKKLKQKQSEIKKQLEQTQKSINQKSKESKSLSSQLLDLDKKLVLVEEDLENVEQQIEQLDSQILKTKIELDRIINNTNESKEIFKKRIRVMYESGNLGYLSVILGSTSFSDFISRLDYLKRIAEYDVRLLTELKLSKEKINQKQNQLLSEQQENETLKSSILEKQNQVQLSKKEREQTLKDINKDLKSLEAMEDKLLAESNAIGKKITSLQSNDKLVSGNFIWPAPGYTKYSNYGYRIHPILKTRKLHTGADIPMPTGSKIVASNAGKVIFAGYYGGYGNAVIIDHGGKVSTLYAHNSKLLVREGDKVERGQAISKAGSTGLSTGPHLHFEVRTNGQPIDPIKYINAN